MSGMDSARMAEMMRAQSAPEGGDPKRFFKDVDTGASISLKAAAPKSFQQPMAGVNSFVGKKEPRIGQKMLSSLGIQTNVKKEGLEAIKPGEPAAGGQGQGEGEIKAPEPAAGKGGAEGNAAVYGDKSNQDNTQGLGLERNPYAAPVYGERMNMLGRLFPPMLRNLAELMPQQLEKIYGAAMEMVGAGVRPMAPISTSSLGELSPPMTPGMAARKKGIQGMEM